MLLPFFLSIALRQGALTPTELIQKSFGAEHLPGGALVSIALLERALKSAEGDDRDLATQWLGTAYSFAGDPRRALQTYDSRVYVHDMPDAVPGSDDLPTGCGSEDALSALEREARSRQIVILNEAHHVPQDRAFILSTLPRLRRLGFRYYAAETFGNVEGFRKAGVPTPAYGYYIREPLFGQIAREVLRLGFIPLEYESRNSAPAGTDGVGRMNFREQEQAENLTQILKKDPKARIVIHVGYDHAFEAPTENGVEWMASRLKRMTGIDPLTVDLTDMREHSRPSVEFSAYRQVAAQGLRRPTVFRKPAGGYWVGGDSKGRVDMQVFLPRTTYRGGRPNWLLDAGRRRLVAIPFPLTSFRRRILVEAKFENEPKDAVPIDRILVLPGETAPMLALVEGDYTVTAYEEDGGELISRPVRVR